MLKPRYLVALLLTTVTAAAVPAASPAPAPMPATASDLASVLEKVSSDDKRVSARLAGLAGEAQRVHALLLARGRSYVKLARAGLLPVGGGLDALVDHASRVERLRRSLARDLDRERAISSERIALSKEHEVLAGKRSILETEHAALARSHMAILAAEDREAAFRRAFLGSGEPTHHTAVYGSATDFGPLDPSELSGGFGAQRGKLRFPIEGRVEIRHVRLPSADGPGLEMVAPLGAPVRSVYPGRVAFADAYADYGNAVIVDHGGGYYSVSGNLSAIDVKVGDDLRPGDRVGAVGTGARGSALYFELRRGAKTVDPATWFGI